MTRLVLVVIATMILTGCVRPGDHPVSPNCEWVESDTHQINLLSAADRRHLRFDAVTAEDMAIRWADQRFGHRPEYDQQTYQCVEKLFGGVAKNHGVELSVVRQYSRERELVVDAPVILGFGIVYVLVAYFFAGRIRRRFPPGEPGFRVMTVTLALGVSLVGVLVGMFLSIIVEGARLNSAHLSIG